MKMNKIIFFPLVIMAAGLAGISCSGDTFHIYEVNRGDYTVPYVPDTTPPTVMSAEAISKNAIKVVFNEEVDEASALDYTNYYIQGTHRVNVLPDPAPVLGDDRKSVTIAISTGPQFGMRHGAEYTLLVQRVKDVDGNAIVNSLAKFIGKGSVVAEVWHGDVRLPETSPYPSFNTSNLEFDIRISNVTTGSYAYSLDGGDYSNEFDISEKLNLPALADGYHTLKVVGKNGETGEWQDLNAATTIQFLVDTVPPVARLSRVPEQVTTSRDIAVLVEGSGVTTYSYRINSDALVENIPVSKAIVKENLPDGEYTLYVWGKDAAGNVQPNPTTCSWTICNNKPVAVISNKPDRYTRLRFATILIGGNDVYYYRYQINDGAWSNYESVDNRIQLNDLPDGDYIIKVIGALRNGDPSSEGPAVKYTWTVDNVAPVCEISNLPANPTNSQKTLISVSSSSPDIAGYRYRLYINGAPQALSGKYMINEPIQLTSLGEGNYTIKVMGVDFAGNEQSEATAAEWSWRVDMQAPKATLSNLPETYTSSNSIDIGVGPADDAVAYKFLLTDTTWSGEIPIKMSINRINLPDDTYTLSVVVRDLAGNWQSLQDPTRHVWTIDTEPPVVVLYDTPPSLTNVHTANISIGGVGVVKYQYRLKKSGVWEDWSVEYNRYTQPLIQLGNSEPLPEGDYVLEVRGFDLAGNRQEIPTSHSWTISDTLPTAVLNNTPKPFTNVDSINITVSNVEYYKYQLDNGSWSNEIDVSTPITASSLSEGPHTLMVIGKVGGNWQTIENATKCNWTVDKTPPVAELTNRPENPTSNQSIAVRVGGVGVYSYKYALALVPEDPDPSGNTEFRLIDNPVIEKSNLGRGTYILKVIARDEAGNWQAVSNATTCIWTVDVDTPTAVFVPATLPSNPTKETLINISVGGTNVVSYKYRLDGAGIWSAETPVSTPISRTGLTAGGHTVYAIGKSASGIWQGENEPTSYNWIVDTTPPSASDIILTNLPNDPTSDTSIDVTVGGSGITHYKYKINSGDWSTSEIPVASHITESGLTDNTYTLYVIARDEVGNWTPADQAKTYTWRVDTILPIAAITNRPENPTNQTGAEFIIGGTGIIEYKYNFDGGGWSSWLNVSSHIILSSLQDGQHTILVCGRKNELLYQADSDATTYTWVVDTQPPTVSLTVNEPQENPTTKTSVNITVGGAGVVAYRYKLDDGSWLPASSEIVVDYPLTLGGLEPKAHTILVKGRDLAGNWSSEVSYNWTIEPPALVSPKTYDTGNITTYSTIKFSWLRPIGTADVKIQIASDSNFTNIVFGGPDGAVIGNTDSYDFIVESSEIEGYYARVSVNDVSGRPANDSSWRAWGQASDGIQVVGGVIGKVRNIFGDNVEGAKVTLKRISGGEKVAECTTDANGDFTLVNVPIGGTKYRIEVEKSGYSGGGIAGISVDIGAYTNVGMLYLVPDTATAGTISGKTVSANTGFVVSSATVKVYNYLGQEVGEGQSDVRGFFTVKKPDNNPFEAGVYRVVFSKNGFFNLEVNNVVVNGNVNIGRQALCEELFEPQVRFIYQWFDFPSDPDIYLTGATAKTVTPAPTNRFIIWSDLKNFNEATGEQWGGITDNGDWYGTSTTASLVMDTVTGFGPEAINMYRFGGAQYAWGVYAFTVHRFAYNPYWMTGNRGKSAVFDLTATLTNGSNKITGTVPGTDKVFTTRCTVTSGSDEVIVGGTTWDNDFYSYYHNTVTGTGIPANSYLTWYDRSTGTNRKFTINNLATANGSSVTITFSRNIDAYGIYPGTKVTGTGIPENTYVRRVTNTGGKNFEIELSNNATVSGAQTVRFYPGWGRTSGIVRIYSSLGLYRAATFPADKLGSDNNAWKVFKLNINGYDREYWKFYEINAVDFIDDDFSKTDSIKPKVDW